MSISENITDKLKIKNKQLYKNCKQRCLQTKGCKLKFDIANSSNQELQTPVTKINVFLTLLGIDMSSLGSF